MLFEHRKWDCIDWTVRRYRRITDVINFASIANAEVQDAAKLWVLHSRFTSKISTNAARLRITVFAKLGEAIGRRGISTVTTSDFEAAEKLIQKGAAPGTSERRCDALRAGSQWLGLMYARSLDYKPKTHARPAHGRGGTEEGRRKKLLSEQVIGDLLSHRHQPGLSVADAFFLDTLMIEVGTGFRISELMTLPAECLLEENGALQVLHFPSKSGQLVPRVVPPKLAAAVRTAVETIRELSRQSRDQLRSFRTAPPVNWPEVARDPVATRYFVGKWVADWVNTTSHRLINPDGGWCNSTRRCYDAVAALKACGGNKSAAARRLGLSRVKFYSIFDDQLRAREGLLPEIRNTTSKAKIRSNWDNDKRTVSTAGLVAATGFTWAKNKVSVSVVEAGLKCQLKGAMFPTPPQDDVLETSFARTPRVVVRTKDDQPLLWEDDALFLLPRYFLAAVRQASFDQPEMVTPRDFSAWLSGTPRANGTDKPEVSVFDRLQIIDERTGEVARFIAHDVRHWLNTVYQSGGLTDDQITLIFNRKSAKQTAVYDQTPISDRAVRLKAAIRGKLAVGRVVDSYHRLLADFSRDDAERYLESAVRMVSPMPHGACTLNWSTVPCPHHLSCFSCDAKEPGPCNFLLVNKEAPAEVAEVRRVAKEARMLSITLVDQGADDSPMLQHAERIARNAETLLAELSSEHA